MIRLPVVFSNYAFLEDYRRFEPQIWDAMRRDAQIIAENDCLIIPPDAEEWLTTMYYDDIRKPCDLKHAELVRLTYKVIATG